MNYLTLYKSSQIATGKGIKNRQKSPDCLRSTAGKIDSPVVQQRLIKRFAPHYNFN
jgi:hypothetical protein